MSATTLHGLEHLVVTFEMAEDEEEEVSVLVVAEAPVYAYIVNDEGLDAFEQAQTFDSYGGSHERKRHERTISLDGPGQYHLLIVNVRPEDIAVYYEVR